MSCSATLREDEGEYGAFGAKISSIQHYFHLLAQPPGGKALLIQYFFKVEKNSEMFKKTCKYLSNSTHCSTCNAIYRENESKDSAFPKKFNSILL